jgi:modulator of FtsH protease HflK
VPVEEDPVEETEQPRRAASAEFVVDAEVGSEAALRAAMDPATQSLADALRLSFRLLQLVIFVLVILFFASGLQTVDEGESGVMVRWGKIVPVAGQESLEPGLHFSGWPYPDRRIHHFDADNLSTATRSLYWPNLGGFDSIETAAAAATVTAVRPHPQGLHGYVLARGGDMGHIRVSAQYQIAQPARFVERMPINMAEKLVQLALNRATVHVSAESSLQQLADRPEQMRFEIQQRAQQMLDELESGIRLTDVRIPDSTVPLAIRSTFIELQSVREEVRRLEQEANRQRSQTLIDVAGERFQDAIDTIAVYEMAVQEGDEEQAELYLRELLTMLESDQFSGEVARIIQFAKAYSSQIESSLGNEARRFASLLPAFREHPEFVVRERWMNAYANVLSRRDTELLFVPSEVGHVKLALSGLYEIKERRQQAQLDRREREAYAEFFRDRRPGQYIPFVDDIRETGPGRQLRIDPETGRAVGLGGRR